jgi:hypothetical protein
MNTEGVDGLPGDLEVRRSELERAFLSVQRERVALTDAFMRSAVECGSAEVETLIVRLLRLQRVVGVAHLQSTAAAAHGRDGVGPGLR